MESSIFSSAICNERKYIPGRRRKWKAMKATKWNKVKKFETWRSWTFFCSLSRVSAHECFKSFCRLPRRDREVVNRLTCFFDMKSKKKTSMIYFKNVVFQLLGNNLVFTRMTWLTQIKKIFKATIWKEHQHHIFYYNLMNCCHLQNSCFFAKSSCKKLHKCNEKVVNPTCKRWSIRTWSFLLYVQFRQVCNTYIYLPNFT